MSCGCSLFDCNRDCFCVCNEVACMFLYVMRLRRHQDIKSHGNNVHNAYFTPTTLRSLMEQQNCILAFLFSHRERERERERENGHFFTHLLNFQLKWEDIKQKKIFLSFLLFFFFFSYYNMNNTWLHAPSACFSSHTHRERERERENGHFFTHTY